MLAGEGGAHQDSDNRFGGGRWAGGGSVAWIDVVAF